MLTHPTLDQLRALNLDGMVQAFIELEAQEEARNLAHAEWLALLLDREAADRGTRRFHTRLRAARLRHSQATVEDVDYRTPRRLDKALFQQLATCRWIAEHRGLLITGPCGVGKSWLSCALAQKACRDGYTVHYARVPRLFADLDLAHGDGRFARLFRMLVKVDLLVLDDWGPDRLSASQRRDLMEIVGSPRPWLHADHQPASRRLLARCDRRADSRRRDPGSYRPQRVPARTRWPLDAQDESQRGDRPGGAAHNGHRSRWQADQGSKELKRTPSTTAAPVGQQGPPARAAASAMGALRVARGSLLLTTGTASTELDAEPER